MWKGWRIESLQLPLVREEAELAPPLSKGERSEGLWDGFGSNGLFVFKIVTLVGGHFSDVQAHLKETILLVQRIQTFSDQSSQASLKCDAKHLA